MTSQNELIYLACPYTHPNREVRTWRFEMANKAAALIIGTGRPVYSPISMTHPIDLVLASAQIETVSAFWVSLDERFMTFCSEIIVLTLEGWKESYGVGREIEFFEQRGRPISFMKQSDVEAGKLDALHIYQKDFMAAK